MENECTFDFAAPQFLASLSDAANLAEEDGADSFFDTVASTPCKRSDAASYKEDSDTFSTPYGKELNKYNKEDKENLLQENEEMDQKTEDQNDDDKENQVSEMPEQRIIKKAKRRSRNTSDNKTSQIRREGKLIFDGIEVPSDTEKDKEHTMVTRQDKVLKTTTLELRARQVIREAAKRKASPKPDEACLNKRHDSKFMSLAEKIMHFQVDTPPRFKSKITSLEEKENRNIHLKPTVPHSPNLITKSRIRPLDVVESEDQKKHVFKASKLNMKVFEKPDNSDRPKPKSPTVPKPFKLTEIQKKELPKEDIFQFKARPMPKSFFGSSDTLNSSITSNCSTRSRRRRQPLDYERDELQQNDDAYSGIGTVNNHNLSTQVKPFSFDERNKEMLKKKEEKIKKIKEEESKVPTFVAAPVPSYILNTSTHSSLKPSVSTTSLFSDNGSVKGGLKGSNFEVNNCDTTFKARFPSVLYKEPFVPNKPERPIIEPLNVELNTERRARERQEFEKELQMKEERMEQVKKEVMDYLERKEKEDIRELRKKLVHKAQPVPPFIGDNVKSQADC